MWCDEVESLGLGPDEYGALGEWGLTRKTNCRAKPAPLPFRLPKTPHCQLTEVITSNSNFVLLFYSCTYFIQDECFRVWTDVWAEGVKNAYQTWGMWARNTTLHLRHTKAGKVTCSECHARSPPFLLAASCFYPSQQPGHLEITWVKYNTNTHSAGTRKSNSKWQHLLFVQVNYSDWKVERKFCRRPFKLAWNMLFLNC